MVECTALEMRHTREGIQGSNPCLSASFMIQNKMMARCRADNPQLPRRFAGSNRTWETAETANIGL